MEKFEKKPEAPEPGDEDMGKFLHPKIVDNIVRSEIEGGVHVKNLEVGHFIEIETENDKYTLERREDGFYISGHPKFCPEPVKAEIHGSTWGGSMLKMGYIGREMFMEFSIPSHPEFKTITTSMVKEVKEFENK
ncbi:MAG: hypothetical protein Q8Q06_04305 [bacterium]|nr:hypothetical protein [bacterium]